MAQIAEVSITLAPIGMNSRVAIDGQPMNNVRRVEVTSDVHGASIVKLELIDVNVRIDGQAEVQESKYQASFESLAYAVSSIPDPLKNAKGRIGSMVWNITRDVAEELKGRQ